MKLNSSIKRLGFIQALGVVLYCGLVGFIFWRGDEIFAKVPNYFGPVAFLILLSSSVLTCALIVFYQPYKLFFSGDKEQAIDLVLATTIWLMFFFLVFLLLAVFLGSV